MKSDNAEAITLIDRQISEFEELLKELTFSLYRLGVGEARLASIKPDPPAPRTPGERRRGHAVLGSGVPSPPMSEEEKQRYEEERKVHEGYNASYQATRLHQKVLERKYDNIYDDTEYVLRKYFPSEDDLKQLRDNVVSNLRAQKKENEEQFRRNPRHDLVFGPSPVLIKCEHYIQASGQCILILSNYRRKIEKFGVQKQIFAQGDIIMGDKPTYSIGAITNSTVSGVALGENISVISNLNTSGQTGLAQALQTLTDAVLASKDLPADQKEDQVDTITQIGKEATKQKPNKITLKGMIDALMGTLKAIPDVAKAVTEVMPLLNHLHL